MPHYLDVGFHWTDKTANGSPPGSPTDAATLSYAFERDRLGEQHVKSVGAGQKDFLVEEGDPFEVRVFELTGLPNIDLLGVVIEVENVGSTGFESPSRRLPGLHTPHPPQGKRDVPSIGLNAQGTAWFPTGPLRLDNPGVFLITVRVRAAMGHEERHWVVDPKLIVGDG